MKISENWKDYSIIATGDGYKLERWKDVYLLRPDPQVIWSPQIDLFSYPKLNAYYKRRRQYFCSEFVQEMLEKFQVIPQGELPDVTTPNDFFLQYRERIVYEGNYRAYTPKGQESEIQTTERYVSW